MNWWGLIIGIVIGFVLGVAFHIYREWKFWNHK